MTKYIYIIKNSVRHWLCHQTVKYPKYSLILVVIVTLLSSIGFITMESSYVSRIWFSKDNPQIIKLNEFEKTFGNDQIITFIYHNEKGVFNQQDLKILQNAVSKIELYPDIVNVESLFNYPFITTQEDEISIEPFIPEGPFNGESKALIKRRLSENSEPLDEIISRDHTLFFIIGYLPPSFEKDPNYRRVYEQANKDIADWNKSGVGKFSLLGDAVAAEEFRRIGLKDQSIMLPLMALLVFVLIKYFFNSIYFFFASMLLSAFTTIFTLGLLGHLGIIYNSIIAAIPGILVGICLADAIHIFNTFKIHYLSNHDYDHSLKLALEHNLKPTFLTSFSTSLSFYSITFTEIIPVGHMGFLVAIGVFIAWLFTYLLLGGLLKIFESKIKTSWENIKPKPQVQLLTDSFIQRIFQFRWLIIVVFLVTSIFAINIASKSIVNSDPVLYFGKGTPFRQVYDFVEGKMQGLRRVSFSVKSQEVEGLKDPEYLQRIDQFIEEVMKDPKMTHVRSMLDILKKMKKNISLDEYQINPLPESSAQTAELLLLYSLSAPAGQSLNSWITTNHQTMLITYRWMYTSSSEATVKMSEIMSIAKKYDLDIEAVGNVPLYTKLNDMVVSSFFYSISLAILMMGVLVLLVFKNIKISLVSMLPNILPLIYGAAALVLMGKYLDIATSIVYAVCLGIAVDDTIHFVANYMKYYQKSGDVLYSIRKVFQTTAKALIVTSIVLFCGFGVFYFADFEPNRNFGIMCAIIISLALITDLILLPAILFIGQKNATKKS